jgi:hypothetical protein
MYGTYNVNSLNKNKEIYEANWKRNKTIEINKFIYFILPGQRSC